MLVLIQGLAYNQRYCDLRFAVKRNVDFEGLVSAASSGFLANGSNTAPVYYGVSGSYYMVNPYISDLYNSPMHREVTFCFDSAFKYGGVALLNQYKEITSFHKRYNLRLRDNYAIMLKFNKTYYYLTPKGNIFCTFKSPFIFGSNVLGHTDYVFVNRNWVFKNRLTVLVKSYLHNSSPLFAFITNTNIHSNLNLSFNSYLANWDFLTQLNSNYYFNNFSNITLSKYFYYNWFALSSKFYINVCAKFYFFKLKDLMFLNKSKDVIIVQSCLNIFKVLCNINFGLKFFVYLFSNKSRVNLSILLINYLLIFLFNNIFKLLQFIFTESENNLIYLFKIYREFMQYLSEILTYFFLSINTFITQPVMKFFWFFIFCKYVIELDQFNHKIARKNRFFQLPVYRNKNNIYANFLFFSNINYNQTLSSKMFFMSNFGLAKYFQFVDVRSLFTISNVSMNWVNFIAARPRIRRIKVERLFMARPLSWTKKALLEGFLKKSRFKSKFYVWVKFFCYLFPIIKRVYILLLQLRIKNFVKEQIKKFFIKKKKINRKYLYFFFFNKLWKKSLIITKWLKMRGLYTKESTNIPFCNQKNKNLLNKQSISYKAKFVRNFPIKYREQKDYILNFFFQFINKILKAYLKKSKRAQIIYKKYISEHATSLIKWLKYLKRSAFRKKLKFKLNFQWQYCKFIFDTGIQNLLFFQTTNIEVANKLESLRIIFMNLKQNINDLIHCYKEVYNSFNGFFFSKFLIRFNFKNFSKLNIVLKNKLFTKYVKILVSCRSKFSHIFKYFFKLFDNLKELYKYVLYIFQNYWDLIISNTGLLKKNLLLARLNMFKRAKAVLNFHRKKKYVKIYKFIRLFKRLNKYYRYAKLRLLFTYKQVLVKKRRNSNLFYQANLFEQLKFTKIYRIFLNNFIKKYFWLFGSFSEKSIFFFILFKLYFFKEFYFYINVKEMLTYNVSISSLNIKTNLFTFKSILYDFFRYYNYLNNKSFELDYILRLKNIFYITYKRFFLFNQTLQTTDVIFIINVISVLHLYTRFFSKYLEIYSLTKQRLNLSSLKLQIKLTILLKILKSFYVFFVVILNYIFNAIHCLFNKNSAVTINLFNRLGLVTINNYKVVFFNNFIKLLNIVEQPKILTKITSRVLWNGFFLKIRKRPEVRKNIYYWHNSYRLNFFDMFSSQFLRKVHQYNRPGFLRRNFRLEFVYPQTVGFVDRIARLANSTDLFIVNYNKILVQYKQNQFFFNNFVRLTKQKIMKFLDLNFHRPRFFDQRPLRRYRLLARNRYYTNPFFIKTLFNINFFHLITYNLFDKFFFNKIDLYKFFYFKYKVFLRSACFLLVRFWKLKQITYIYMFLFEIVQKTTLFDDFRLFEAKQKLNISYFTSKITYNKIRTLFLCNIFLLFKFFLNFRNFVNFYFSLNFLKFFFNNCTAYLNTYLSTNYFVYQSRICNVLKFFKIYIYLNYSLQSAKNLAVNLKKLFQQNIVGSFCLFWYYIHIVYYIRMCYYLKLFVAFFKVGLNNLFVSFLNRTKIRFLFKFFFVFFVFTLKIIFMNFLTLALPSCKSFLIYNVLNKFLALCFFDIKFNLSNLKKIKFNSAIFNKKPVLFFSMKDSLYFKHLTSNVSWNLNLLKTFKIIITTKKLPFLYVKTARISHNFNQALRAKYIDFIQNKDLFNLFIAEPQNYSFFDFFSYKHFYITSLRKIKDFKEIIKIFNFGFNKSKFIDLFNIGFFFGVQPKFKQLSTVLLRRKIASKFTLFHHQDSIENNINDRFLKSMLSFSYLMKRSYTKYAKHKYNLSSNLEILRLNRYIYYRFVLVMENYLRLKKMVDTVFDSNNLNSIFKFFVQKRGFSFLLGKNISFNLREFQGLSKLFDKYKMVCNYIRFINQFKYTHALKWYYSLTIFFKTYVSIYKLKDRYQNNILFNF